MRCARIRCGCERPPGAAPHSGTVGVRLVMPGPVDRGARARAGRPAARPPGHRVQPGTNRRPSCSAPPRRGTGHRNPGQPPAQSNCLVTGQPDWGSVQIAYTRRANRPGRAAAVHRQLPQSQQVPRAMRGAHLHGHLAALPPIKLAVYARYTRRGGLDIRQACAPPDAAAGQPAHGAAVASGTKAQVHVKLR